MPGIPFLVDDIDCFFEESELAVKARIGGVDILVIYREDYFNPGDGVVGIDNTSPYILARISDIPGAKRGDLLEIIEVDETYTAYLISAVRPASSELYARVFLEVV